MIENETRLLLCWQEQIQMSGAWPTKSSAWNGQRYT